MAASDSLPQWMQNLIEGWPMIRANLPTFLVILVLMGGILWLVFSWSYGSVIANKNSQIELQDRQLADYKEKLSGATPDEAKARIDKLEARLAALEPRLVAVEPRRLKPDQRAGLIARLSAPQKGISAIAIVSEAAGDSPQFAADLVSVFKSAGGWIIDTPSVLGINNRPPSGLAVQFVDPPDPEATLVMRALREQNIKFDIQHSHVFPWAAVSLLICEKIEE